MNQEEIFYPNKLTPEEVEQLSGWKLKVATLHFGKGRSDCIKLDYGYGLVKPFFNEEPTIHLVADERGEAKPYINLADEIDWNNPASLIAECGIKIDDIYRKRIKDQLKEWFEDTNAQST